MAAIEHKVATMASLPSLPKKEPRTVSVTIRLSRKSRDALRILSKEHNISQAYLVEHLVSREYEEYIKRKEKTK